jgi:hypothetical protein
MNIYLDANIHLDTIYILINVIYVEQIYVDRIYVEKGGDFVHIDELCFTNTFLFTSLCFMFYVFIYNNCFYYVVIVR